MADYSVMEPALELLAAYGPDLQNGLTSHAPMAAEALVALGRAEAVMPWLEGYRRGLVPRPRPRQRIPGDGWRPALGATERTADWSEFFVDQLREAPWREVLERWSQRLGPAICASAAHGVIRVGHAARSLSEALSPARLRELADGLGYWAANYQTLPTADGASGALRARDGIAKVPLVPPERRKFTGTIVSSLEALGEFPAFGPVIGLIDVDGPLGAILSDLTEIFTRVYLSNAHDVLSTIVFVHGVTGVAAVRSMLPHLSDGTGRDLVRYAWQASCGLYSAFGSAPPHMGEVEPPRESRDTLVDLALANGDEHAIKFTEACLREFDLNPSSAYLAAARHVLGVLNIPVPSPSI
jgi:hypothetical protein